MYPTLTVGFSNPLRKDNSFLQRPPKGCSRPILPAEGYRNRNTCVIHESMASFGLSFGCIQATCNRALNGTWRISQPCIVVGYSESGQIQLAIRGYGDAIAPWTRQQTGAPVPKRTHFFFANAGTHQLYYFAFSTGMLDLLIEDMPALYRLGRIPDDDTGDHWQDYDVTDEEFAILYNIRSTELSGVRRHQFLQQQFYRLMERYHQRIDLYGDDPFERTRPAYLKAIDYIQEHYRNPHLSRAEIAAAVFLSESALEKAFLRNNFKCTPYINALRIYHGRDLLRDIDLSVDEVAFQSGFKNRIRFTELFKAKFGVTPTEYRNQLIINKKIGK